MIGWIVLGLIVIVILIMIMKKFRKNNSETESLSSLISKKIKKLADCCLHKKNG